MSLGQTINVSKEARDPTYAESMAWRAFLDAFEELSDTVDAYVSTVDVAAVLQDGLNQKGIPKTCFSDADQLVADGILDRYNTLGRLKLGVTTWRYWISIEEGQLVIVAPPGMTSDQYAKDIYPGPPGELGAWPLVIVALVWGTVLIAGAYATVKALESYTESRDQELRKKVLDTDREMINAPESMRKAWQELKKGSGDLLAKANQAHTGSWFESMTTGAGAGAIGGLIVVVGLALAFGLRRKEQ